ncbi:MAG: DNA-directed RNA polymerase subunit omega [Candidatus Tumulicola sp.]
MSDMLDVLAEPDERLAEGIPKAVKRVVKSPSNVKSSEAPQIIRNSAEQAVHKSGSPFTAVNAIAKRSRQLLGGAPPLIMNANPEKPAMTALREIASGAVQVSGLPLGPSFVRGSVDPERELAMSRRTLRERTRFALFGGVEPSK